MSRPLRLNWKFIFVSPLVLVGVGWGLWIALTAAYANVQLTRAGSQILRAVDEARDMKLMPSVGADRATIDLYDRLALQSSMNVSGNRGTASRTLVNPWGGFVILYMLPAAQQLWMEMSVPPVVCRRLMEFAGEEAMQQVLLSAEARESAVVQDYVGARRVLYEASGDGSPGVLDPSVYTGGCGSKTWVTMVLRFRLR